MHSIVVVFVPPCRGVSMYRTRDLVDLALKGIPEKYRVEIWMVYTGTCVVCMFLHCNIAF